MINVKELAAEASRHRKIAESLDQTVSLLVQKPGRAYTLNGFVTARPGRRPMSQEHKAKIRAGFRKYYRKKQQQKELAADNKK